VVTAPIEIVVSLTRQTLQVCREGRVEREFLVSTSRYGPGEQRGSLCTPRGQHFIRAKIGRGLPTGAVLRGRRPTGEVYSPALQRAQPGRDWILSRILWLSGLEVGRNRLGDVDSMRRYIYIHGTPDQEPMGVPFSHGCIRMRNADVCWLFDAVIPGTPVNLVP
jgi:lipoprotein-anchoring transpeptidase ErfK/SrfK